MCPVCIANLTLIAAGASSTGGLAAFAIKKLFRKTEQNHRTNRIGREQREMRNNGGGDRSDRNHPF
jgi:hypothetical protein